MPESDRIKAIGSRIKELRSITNLSRRAFCARYPIAFSTLGTWENGIREPSIENIITLLKAFNSEGITVSKKWLINGSGQSPLSDGKKLDFEKPKRHEKIQRAIENNQIISLNQKLYDAVKNNHRYEIIKLINLGADLHNADNYRIHVFDDHENSLLHLATLNASIEMLELLLDKGMNINIKNRREETILHHATFKGHRHIITFLIKRGIILNSMEIEGDTSLGWAAYLGQLDIAELLLSKGADINHKNKIKNTPLHWACYRGHYDLVKLLIKNKANLYSENYQKKLAIDLAEENGHIDTVELLVTEMNL